MPAAMFTRWRTAIRDSEKARVTHVGVSTDSTPFAANQTTLNPGGGTNLIKTATKTDVDAGTFDATISINGTSEFTNQTIMTLAPMDGSAASAALGRVVRSLGIGVTAGDAYTIGVRVANSDIS